MNLKKYVLFSAILIVIFSFGGQFAPENHLFLENGVIKIGANLNWGGAIDFISYYASPNLVDEGIPDPGREIQISLYDGNDYYEDCWDGQWGWNPVQAGDRKNNGSGVIASYKEGNLIYTKCQPLQYNGSGVSDIILEQWVSLEYGLAIKIKYKVIHLGNDFHEGRYHGHEFPCVYLKPTLEMPWFVTYQGSLPWTNDPYVQMFQLDSSKAWGNYFDPVPEKWISLTDAKGYGITLYVQTQNRLVFSQAFAQNRDGSFPVNVFQAWNLFDISPGSIHEAIAYFIFGHWQDSRKLIYQIHNSKESEKHNASLRKKSQNRTPKEKK